MPISTVWFSAKIIVSLTIPEILDSVSLCESLEISHPELVDEG